MPSHVHQEPGPQFSAIRQMIQQPVSSLRSSQQDFNVPPLQTQLLMSEV